MSPRITHKQLAGALNNLATHLETIVEDETSHYEETEKILRGW